MAPRPSGYKAKKACKEATVALEVKRNSPRSRYEVWVDGRMVGKADYRLTGSTVVFFHTEVAPSLRGRGIGEELARGALDDVRATGREVEPQCWFFAQFIDDHPTYADLLAA
jgi:predicted GNAT family acetyltransferase